MPTGHWESVRGAPPGRRWGAENRHTIYHKHNHAAIILLKPVTLSRQIWSDSSQIWLFARQCRSMLVNSGSDLAEFGETNGGLPADFGRFRHKCGRHRAKSGNCGRVRAKIRRFRRILGQLRSNSVRFWNSSGPVAIIGANLDDFRQLLSIPTQIWPNAADFGQSWTSSGQFWPNLGRPHWRLRRPCGPLRRPH